MKLKAGDFAGSLTFSGADLSASDGKLVLARVSKALAAPEGPEDGGVLSIEPLADPFMSVRLYDNQDPRGKGLYRKVDYVLNIRNSYERWKNVFAVEGKRRKFMSHLGGKWYALAVDSIRSGY